MTALLERLRRQVFDTTAFCPMPSYRNPDGPEAASLIEEQDTTIKLQAQRLMDLSSEIMGLRALLAKLETGDTDD
jgi:hypothetical protein